MVVAIALAGRPPTTFNPSFPKPFVEYFTPCSSIPWSAKHPPVWKQFTQISPNNAAMEYHCILQKSTLRTSMSTRFVSSSVDAHTVDYLFWNRLKEALALHPKLPAGTMLPETGAGICGAMVQCIAPCHNQLKVSKQRHLLKCRTKMTWILQNNLRDWEQLSTALAKTSLTMHASDAVPPNEAPFCHQQDKQGS